MILLEQPIPGSDDLLERLRSFCCPCRPLLIAVDGRNGAGKTSLARYLAWRLGMPVLETDLWMCQQSPVKHRIEELKKLVQSRHRRARPVIIEGVMMLRTLELIGINPDYLIFVTNETLEPEEDEACETEEGDETVSSSPCLSEEVSDYLKAQKPWERADHHFRWRRPPFSYTPRPTDTDLDARSQA